MNIIKNRFKSWCGYCGKNILLDEYPYKVKHGQDTFHLICYYKWLKKRIKNFEIKLSELKKFEKKMKKYNTQLLLETLGDKG
jgi:hypothetical protein